MRRTALAAGVAALALAALLAPRLSAQSEEPKDSKSKKSATSKATLETLNQGQTEIRAELEALKEAQKETQDQLAEIKKLLQQQPQRAAAAPPAAPAGPAVKDVVFELGQNDVKGAKDAKLTLIEFTDYQCPFCARYVRDTYPQIDKEYVQTGKLRYVLLDLPLESIHKNAFTASEATYCAQDQGKYWEMHDRLFANQQALEPWSGHAQAIGLDVAQFDACLAGNKHDEAIRADMKEAQKVGITGTPGFVIGLTDPKDPTKVKGLSFIRGAQAFAAFKSQIDPALGGAN